MRSHESGLYSLVGLDESSFEGRDAIELYDSKIQIDRIDEAEPLEPYSKWVHGTSVRDRKGGGFRKS